MDRVERSYIDGNAELDILEKEIEFPLIRGRKLVILSTILGLVASVLLWLQTIGPTDASSPVLLLAIAASVFTAGTLLGTRTSLGSYVQIPGLVMAMVYLALVHDFKLFDGSYLLMVQAFLWGTLAVTTGFIASASGAYGRRAVNQ